MKVSDYIVEYLINKNITDVFGYPGGMVTHLMDSFRKYQEKISAHATYNEQGAAMAACGYAQTSGKTGVAYATSGPGATNMITGICNAYMDSIPTIFITGQVNSFEQKGEWKVRQRGFQETDIVSMVSNVTKYAVRINSADEIQWNLDYAFYIANEGRKGPVLLDIAMDVTRAEICPFRRGGGYHAKEKSKRAMTENEKETIKKLIKNAKCPVLLLGNGVPRGSDLQNKWKKKINKLSIPVVSSMIAVDIKGGLDSFYGFIGAYGDRTANFIVAKSDLVIAVGARLDIRQVGAKRENFAKNASLVRIDIDKYELEYKVHSDEYDCCADAGEVMDDILDWWNFLKIDYSQWNFVCNKIKQKLNGMDNRYANDIIQEISRQIPDHVIITTDVGQNQVWVAQSFDMKSNQRILFSGGHGAMGYSLPAAIGAALGAKNKVYSFNGDGGIQMNIQELQVLSKERLPIKVIVLNNHALGMIRQFQEMYFDNHYFQTVPEGGFYSPDFRKIAEAYRIEYGLIKDISDIGKMKELFENDNPAIIEVRLSEYTYVFPKLQYNKPNQDQEPLINRELYKQLMDL